MEKTNYELELKNERRRVCSLLYEIDRRKQQSFEMERKYNNTTATLQGLIDGLIAKINSKDSCLWDWELRYNETMRQLKGENAALRRVFAEGGTMNGMLSFDVTRFASRALIDLRVILLVRKKSRIKDWEGDKIYRIQIPNLPFITGTG
ncbi:hypothetical protein Gotur_019862, partial [Gossypium turneri]